MILISGASGFVGRHLSKHLQGEGKAVRTVGRRPNVSDVTIGEIDASTDWQPALVNIDQVVHLAARVHVMKDAATDPLAESRKVNRDGTLRFARQAAVAGVRRFVFISTLKVNGEETSPGRPFMADDEPDPQDAYAVSKWEAEQGLATIARETGMEVVIIRPPLIYGHGVRANFAALQKLAHTRLPLPFGCLKAPRSLLYVGNLSSLISTCLDHPMAAGKTFLASDGEDVSVGDLVSRLRGLEGRRPNLLPVPVAVLRLAAHLLRRREIVQRLAGSLQVDLSATRAVLNWTPPYTLDQGLADMVEQKAKTDDRGVK